MRRQCADLYRENQEIRMELAVQRRKIERVCERYEEYHTGSLHCGTRGRLHRDTRDLHCYREGLHNDRENLNDHAGAFHLNSESLRNDTRDLHMDYDRGDIHHYEDELYFDEEIQTIFHKIHRLIQLL